MSGQTALHSAVMKLENSIEVFRLLVADERVDRTLTASYDEGIFWHTDNGYGIYRTSGAWSGDYQQLKLKWLTGIILDGGHQYGKSGVEVQGNMNNVFRINTTSDGKIQLKGSSNP